MTNQEGIDPYANKSNRTKESIDRTSLRNLKFAFQAQREIMITSIAKKLQFSSELDITIIL